MRSLFAPVVVPLVAAIIALGASLARWLTQGSHNVYTAIEKRFYVPDPDLGWRVSPEHPVWLGLEICVLIAGIIAGVAGAGWLIRRREAKQGQRASVLRVLVWPVAIAPLIIPVVAFSSGGRPAGGVDTLPAAVARGLEAGITGTLDAPEGKYEVVQHAGTSITAHLSAGKETFDARFTGGIKGTWTADPRDLTKPIAAEISVDTKSVDTGIEERSKHARESYLQADKFPAITVALDKVLATKQAGANAIEFRAHGTLSLIGKSSAIEVTGTLRKPDAAALTRLGLSGDVLLVQAGFAIVIKDSALAGDAGDFDGPQIPIQISLVLRRTGG